MILVLIPSSVNNNPGKKFFYTYVILIKLTVGYLYNLLNTLYLNSLTNYIFLCFAVPPEVLTRNQAWNRCNRNQLILPFNESTKDELVKYMEDNSLDTCWMGVKKKYYDKGTFIWLDGEILGK